MAGDDTFDVCAVGDGAEFERQAVCITVIPDNDPPVADAGRDRPVPSRTEVSLDGSTASDPDGDVLSDCMGGCRGRPALLRQR